MTTEKSEPVKQHFSWEDYATLVSELAAKIDFKPDVIVSIGKGGSIPGVMLAEHFDAINLNFGLRSYDSYYQDKMVEYQSPDHNLLKEFKVLLVDDLADSGDTFFYALDKFKQNSVGDVKTASVFKKSESKYVPDYYVKDIPSSTWIVQPWEKSLTIVK